MNSETLRAIKSELEKARKRYPTNVGTLRILRHFVDQLENELSRDAAAVQIFATSCVVAVMAIRVAEEGDSKFKYASYVQNPGPLFREYNRPLTPEAIKNVLPLNRKDDNAK
jgi:hypothetical protein